tara:strand:- start:569 stop:820 length:252 start_codon:yes stop_codon:yes gene_type:complete
MTMDLEITELSEVCSVLRTYISQSKRANKKNRLKDALKKLEVELSYKESRFSRQIYSGGFVTFKENNLCPTCKQPKLTSTLAE